MTWSATTGQYVTAFPSDLTAHVDLGHISGESVSATLWVNMWGYSSDTSINPDHRAEFYVNDQLRRRACLGREYPGPMDPTDFPQSYLVDGVNALRAHFPGTSVDERIMFDRFEMDYGHDP